MGVPFTKIRGVAVVGDSTLIVTVNVFESHTALLGNHVTAAFVGINAVSRARIVSAAVMFMVKIRRAVGLIRFIILNIT